MTNKVRVKRIRWTIDKICPLLEQEGFTLLSTEYKGVKTKLSLLCPMGHDLRLSWQSFLEGHRCKYCKWKDKRVGYKTIQKGFAEEGYLVLEDGLNKDKIEARTILKVRCPQGHLCEKMSWTRFKDLGIRCKQCFLDKRRVNVFDIKIHLESQGYSLLTEDYHNCKEKLNVLCPKGHKWSVRWNDFQQGHRCSRCFVRQSKNEKKIVGLYTHLNLKESTKEILGSKELDLYFPDHKVAIEYCGLYWHGDQHERITPSYHRDKMDQCIEKNIRLLTIFEDEWILHKDICISRINNALGICPTRIPARKCEAREISKKEAKEFLNRTHLQGYGRCKIPFGLYYKGKLVQVMTWGSPARAHTAKGKKVLEMKRLAGELNTVIIGGAGRLFKLGLQYAKDNGYDSLKSYCDLRWGTGNLYKKLGFSKTYETRYTPHYTDGVNRYRNQVLAQNKNKTGKTEAEVAQEKGLWKIYDCGHSTWEYEVS